MIYGLVLLLAAGSVSAALLPCVCVKNFQPVCGSDGNTYSNQCMLDCAKKVNSDLTTVRLGRCSKAEKTCVCTLEYRPVCGSDGETYPNKCALNCQRSVRLVGDGPCPQAESLKLDKRCVCTREENPVCGSDGVNYSNPCMLNCATANKPSLSIKYYGHCVDEVKVVDEALSRPSCACTRNMQPVCGSDGVTYSNPCMLNCATKLNPGLSMVRTGPCEDVNVEVPTNAGGCACTRQLAPVCGSDGVSYNSPCIMRCRNPAAQLVHDGPCEE